MKDHVPHILTQLARFRPLSQCSVNLPRKFLTFSTRPDQKRMEAAQKATNEALKANWIQVPAMRPVMAEPLPAGTPELRMPQAMFLWPVPAKDVA